MKVALIGGFGNVGKSTLSELMNIKMKTIVFDRKSKTNQKEAKRFLKKYPKLIDVFWGDLTNYDDIKKFFELHDGITHVIHVAAIIPPLAYEKPALANLVNVEGTKMLVDVLQKRPNPPVIIYTSSVAVYGDRLNNNFIKLTDPVNPNPGDNYAESKIKAERIIQESSLEYLIFRLSFITSSNLKLDPLMFNVPLDTSIEVLDTRDVGIALTHATTTNMEKGVYHLAGGEKNRTTYREFLNKMMRIFGFDKNPFPDQAFAKNNFSCGFMDTTKSQTYLKYQRVVLDEYYTQMGIKYRFIRRLVSSFRSLIRPLFTRSLLKQSAFYNSDTIVKTIDKSNKLTRKPLASLVQGKFTLNEGKQLQVGEN